MTVVVIEHAIRSVLICVGVLGIIGALRLSVAAAMRRHTDHRRSS